MTQDDIMGPSCMTQLNQNGEKERYIIICPWLKADEICLRKQRKFINNPKHNGKVFKKIYKSELYLFNP